MAKVRARLVAAAALLAGSLAVTVGGAEAAVLSCGQTINVSTVLENDVGPCNAGGITIGADNITFDLNGHTIFGVPPALDLAGVYLLGRTGVTVKNGTVRNFDVGVAIEGGSGNTVTGIVARDNIGASTGIGGDGIAILSSSENRIIGNSTINNAPFSGIGIYSRIDANHGRATAGRSTNNLVDGNQVVGNKIGRNRFTTQDTDNDGIRIENDGVANVISNNFVYDSGLDGIALFADNFDTIVRGNTVQRNGFYRTTARRGSGIIVFNRGARNVVESNQVIGNADSGIDIRGVLGVNAGATAGRIVNNTAVGNSALPFIPSPVFGPSFDLKDGNVNCDANTWLGNRYRTFNQPCVTTGGQQV